MTWLFQITDKSRRNVHLSMEKWDHINVEHPEITAYIEEIKETIKKPLKLIKFDDSVVYYYKYFKNRTSHAKYLLVIGKYLNGHGFIITSYFVRNIK